MLFKDNYCLNNAKAALPLTTPLLEKWELNHPDNVRAILPLFRTCFNLCFTLFSKSLICSLLHSFNPYFFPSPFSFPCLSAHIQPGSLPSRPLQKTAPFCSSSLFSFPIYRPVLTFPLLRHSPTLPLSLHSPLLPLKILF